MKIEFIENTFYDVGATNLLAKYGSFSAKPFVDGTYLDYGHYCLLL